jgi:uncharacterized protein YukE
MAGFTGMDIPGVRTLATQMKAKADEIEGIQRELTSKLQGTQWVGPDRQQFEGDWNGQYSNSLRQVAQALRDAAQRAEQNATQQEQASNA